MLGASLAVPSFAGAAGDPVMKPILNFSIGFNTNNIALAKSAFVKTGIVILDEIAPHVWTGRDAVDQWLKDLDIRATKDGITDSSVKFGKTLVETSNGTTAYVVASVEYFYKQHGTPMHEPATITFALKKVGGAYLISGWSWNGTVPKPGP